MGYRVVLTFKYDVDGDNPEDAIDEAYSVHYQEAQFDADADSIEVFEY